MPNFYFRTIGDATALNLHERVKRGESAVILGPSGVGKRYLIDLVNQRRVKGGLTAISIAHFGKEEMTISEAKVVAALVQESKLTATAESLEEWTLAVSASASANNPLKLVVTNVDGMSKALAHKFLTCVRELVMRNLLVIVITGEGNLVDLVDGGPNSAWDCAHQYVVHAHDRKHFGRFLTKRMRQFQLQFSRKLGEARKLFCELYRRTGGDVSIMRATLWSITDNLNFHLKEPNVFPVRLGLDDIPQELVFEHIVPTAGVVPFLYSTRCVLAAAREAYPPSAHQGSAQSITVLSDLEKLIAGQEPVLADSHPHVLELAGLAGRNCNDELIWFSEYAKGFALPYFTHQRLGDYYAFAHDWDNAYRLYELIESPLLKCRPLSDDDYVTLMRLLDGLAVHFHRTIRNEPDEGDVRRNQNLLEQLRQELRRALIHMLGFPDNL
ncbi:MAG: hypothetical protein NTV80_06830, partial [Verrucomicrobia bacterium]|nr:hypothetical protein [Verrucomicrobiota bacterium]